MGSGRAAGDGATGVGGSGQALRPGTAQLSDVYESRDEPQSTDLLLALGAARIQAGAGGEAEGHAASCHRECPKLMVRIASPKRSCSSAIGGIGVNEVDDELIRLLEGAPRPG